jgi:hypothetical protein
MHAGGIRHSSLLPVYATYRIKLSRNARAQ